MGISFIRRQQRDWKVTVARTSLDRLAYQMVFPYLSIYIVALGATATQLGIMTGIGFLGAGIIYQEGFSVRGLTTAGSIWVTAAIGILYGIGFYFPAVLATLTALGILSVFRWFEKKLPSQQYVHLHICFERDKIIAENDLRTFMAQHGYSVASMSYSLVRGGQHFEYRMVISTTGRTASPESPNPFAPIPSCVNS